MTEKDKVCYIATLIMRYMGEEKVDTEKRDAYWAIKLPLHRAEIRLVPVGDKFMFERVNEEDIQFMKWADEAVDKFFVGGVV